MKFREFEQTPPHQNRRLQMRMLGWVGVIAVAMFAWQAVRIGMGWGSGNDGTSRKQATRTPDSVGHRVLDDDLSPLREDEIRILPRPAGTVAEDDDEEPEIGKKRTNVAINPAWLKSVHDNTVGIRRDESEAYYRILAKAQTISPQEMQTHVDPEALYVNVMTYPEKFRGRPITITGDLGKLYEFRAPDNVYGLTTLYEAWIVTADSGNHPYRVVCSSIPPEIKPPDSSRRAVTVTGYFFKREGYETPGGRLHVAPTLLAGKLALYVSPHSPPPVEHMVPWMVGIVSVIGLAMLATVIGFALNDARGRRGYRITSNVDQLQPLDLDRLSRADRRISIEESMRRLAEGEKVNDDSPMDDEADAYETNGHGPMDLTDAPDEYIDLPTPFPPTRVPKRWDERN